MSPAGHPPFFVAEQIGKRTAEGFELADIGFTLPRFQKLAVSGETGSGKTTLLKILSGLLQPDAGTVMLEGARIKGPAEQLLPGHPRIGYLSQHYELRNHYRVDELLDMANKQPGDAAAAVYDVCRISHLLRRRSDQLSGGERQRVALARVLTALPALLILDEPFSNLDLIHKSILKEVLEDAGSRMGITFILSSHDPQDVLSWADQIMVLRGGRQVQAGTPDVIYRQPADEYVAGIFGKYNVVPATLFPQINAVKPRDSMAMIRPEHIDVSTTRTANTVAGRVISMRLWGAYFEVIVDVRGHRVIAYAGGDKGRVGGEVHVSVKDARTFSFLLPAEAG